MLSPTASRELGHTSAAMVERVYAHLGDVRHCAEVVEFRIEQHRVAKLKDGLTVAARLQDQLAGGEIAR